jgi:flagella basal body P-ring formation protein FlgA
MRNRQVLWQKSGTRSRVIGLLFVALAASSSFIWQSQGACRKSSERARTSTKLRVSSSGKTIKALYSAREISKGAVITLDDLDADEVLESSLPSDAVNYEAVIVGRTSKSDLRKGSLIRLRDCGLRLVPNYLPRIPALSQSRIPQPLLYSATNIPEGSVIDFKVLEVRKVLLNKIPPNSIVSPYGAIGRKATTFIPKGQIIYESDVGIDY